MLLRHLRGTGQGCPDVASRADGGRGDDLLGRIRPAVIATGIRNRPDQHRENRKKNGPSRQARPLVPSSTV